MLSFRVFADEVTVRLDQFPSHLQKILRRKFEAIFDTLTEDILSTVPGKYLDPSLVQTGVTQQGSMSIGFFEVQGKPGFYAIYPTKANLLKFISKLGDVVFTPRVLYHPYPQPGPTIEKALRQRRDWIEEKLGEAVSESLRRRR